MAKISISIDDDLLRRLDDYCDKNFFTRSGCIAMSVNQTLLTDEVRCALSNMAKAFEMISERGEITEENKKALEEFKIIANVFGGKLS